MLLNIITITKDDLPGVMSTVESTRSLRKHHGVVQTIIDGSSDPVKKQTRNLAENEENVIYTWLEPSGISSAFNRGLDASTADWVWFLNGGDTFHPSTDCTIFLGILQNNNADAIIFQIETKQSRIRFPHPPMWKLWPPVTSWIPHPATLLKRQLFKTHGYFNEEYKIAMDFEMWFRLFSKNVVVDLISLPVVIYDESGISNTRIEDTASEAHKILLSKSKMLLKKWLGTARTIYESEKYYRKTGKLK